MKLIWCKHPWCNRIGVGTGNDATDAAILARHMADPNECDGLRHDTQVADYEARTRLAGRWTRVARRWGLSDEGAER